MIDGASVNNVMTASTLIAPSTSVGCPRPLSPMFKFTELPFVWAEAPP